MSQIIDKLKLVGQTRAEQKVSSGQTEGAHGGASASSPFHFVFSRKVFLLILVCGVFFIAVGIAVGTARSRGDKTLKQDIAKAMKVQNEKIKQLEKTLADMDVRQKKYSQNTDEKFKIDVSSLVPGFYLVKFVDGHKTITKKLIKEDS